jgi:hypothetical protein
MVYKVAKSLLGDEIDFHRATHGKCVGVDSGVDMRGGFSQLRHRVP